MIPINATYTQLLEQPDMKSDALSLVYQGPKAFKDHYWDIEHKKHGTIGYITADQKGDYLDVGHFYLHKHPETGKPVGKTEPVGTLGAGVVRKFMRQIKRHVPSSQWIGSSSKIGGVERSTPTVGPMKLEWL